MRCRMPKVGMIFVYVFKCGISVSSFLCIYMYRYSGVWLVCNCRTQRVLGRGPAVYVNICTDKHYPNYLFIASLFGFCPMLLCLLAVAYGLAQSACTGSRYPTSTSDTLMCKVVPFTQEYFSVIVGMTTVMRGKRY